VKYKILSICFYFWFGLRKSSTTSLKRQGSGRGGGMRTESRRVRSGKRLVGSRSNAMSSQSSHQRLEKGTLPMQPKSRLHSFFNFFHDSEKPVTLRNRDLITSFLSFLLQVSFLLLNPSPIHIWRETRDARFQFPRGNCKHLSL